MERLNAYTILRDHYKPIIEVILKRLDELDNPKDKIQYLKSEELKYLIDVTMNPNLMAASGVVTTNNPHKAGLDRWIEYKIKEIELTQEAFNKGKMLSYVWLNNPDRELPELYNMMVKKHKLIASETSYEQFKATFSGQLIDESFEPIRWHQNNSSELLYFISRLEQSNNIMHNPNRADYRKLKACFVKPDGSQFNVAWKSLKTNIEISLSTDKQKAIDELVGNF